MKNNAYDAIIIGAGPNGLAAAIRLAQHRLSVLLVEANAAVGGGVRSAELTRPGFVHDVCSAIHPLTVGSPFFAALPLKDYGLEFIAPPVELAHPLDDAPAVTLKRSLRETAAGMGEDAENYRNLFAPFVEKWHALAPDILAPLRFPKHPFSMADFGLKAFRSGRSFAEKYFTDKRARAIFAGIAGHSMIPLEHLPSAAIGVVLSITAHSVGWQFPRGGAQKIPDALAGYFVALGGEIRTNFRVENLDELPAAKAILFDLTPRQIISIAGHRLPPRYKCRLEKFRYGAGAFKIDFALDAPIPWKSPECARAATVHLGGTFDEIAVAEREIWHRRPPEKPFVLLAQNSLFDDTRTPAGKHIAWAYAHVPNNSEFDMTDRIERQIERFAPGFRDCILDKHIIPAARLETYNANYIGGDISGGANVLSQLFTRPVASRNPYKIPSAGLYICSSSTPPGGGVHGMCGYHAAQSVLKNEFPDVPLKPPDL